MSLEKRSIIKILTDAFIFFTVIGVIAFLYVGYGERMLTFLYGKQQETVFIDDVSLKVDYAITPQERAQGLSGRESLATLEGLLFFFEDEDYHGIWMKDMLFPIDIIWINEDMVVVHVAENVTPDTFPAVFEPDEPARFVLEMNAFFADTYSINEGDKLLVPAADLPTDLKARLQ